MASFPAARKQRNISRYQNPNRTVGQELSRLKTSIFNHKSREQLAETIQSRAHDAVAFAPVRSLSTQVKPDPSHSPGDGSGS